MKPSPLSRISGLAAAFTLLASPLAALSGTATEPSQATAGLDFFWPSAPAPALLMVTGTVLVALVIGRRISARRRTASES